MTEPASTPPAMSSSSDKAFLQSACIVRLRQELLAWYAANGRDLPWRHTQDPYAVWVSEMMLQQTQVATVIPYFHRWMARFPTLAALAAADEQEVLHAWQGLGYYRRARSLLNGAKVVLEERGGVFPRDVETLLTLPGIGPYTAGAIASIAFDKPVPVVDGNVIRVLTRLFSLQGDPARSPLKSQLWRIAGELVSPEEPGDFNQAVMELGATICSPASPRCGHCPVSDLCRAYDEGRPEAYPETASAPKVTTVRMAAAVIRQGDRVALVRHAEDAARWAGMWHFPSGECADAESDEEAAVRIAREITGLEVRPTQSLTVIRHSVTRYRIALKPVVCEVVSSERPAVADWIWVERARLGDYPLPAAHQKIGRLLGTGQSALEWIS